jgi:hypothetical protein
MPRGRPRKNKGEIVIVPENSPTRNTIDELFPEDDEPITDVNIIEDDPVIEEKSKGTEIFIESNTIDYATPKKMNVKKSKIPIAMMKRTNDPIPEEVDHYLQSSIDFSSNKTLIELLNNKKKQITKMSILIEFDNNDKNIRTINLI